MMKRKMDLKSESLKRCIRFVVFYIRCPLIASTSIFKPTFKFYIPNSKINLNNYLSMKNYVSNVLISSNVLKFFYFTIICTAKKAFIILPIHLLVIYLLKQIQLWSQAKYSFAPQAKCISIKIVYYSQIFIARKVEYSSVVCQLSSLFLIGELFS